MPEKLCAEAFRYALEDFTSRLVPEFVGHWEQEYRFYPDRKCAFDFACPVWKIALEIEGGVWLSTKGGKSRHFTGSGATRDMIKYNAATRLGWRVFRYSGNGKSISTDILEKAKRDIAQLIGGNTTST